MILWADSFDHYGTDELMLTDGPWAEVGADISNVRARTGTYSMVFAMGASIMRRVFGAAQTNVGVGATFYLPAMPGANDYCVLHEFRDAGNVAQVSLILQSTGALAIYTGRVSVFVLGTLQGTSLALVSANAWNHIEMYSHIHGSTGSIEVRLNGVTVLNAAGINTNPTGTGEASQWATYNQVRYMDDIIAWNTSGVGSPNIDFIGDKKVFTDFPDADTAAVDWVPSSGATRFAMVDEAAPDGDATSAAGENPGDVMGLSFPDVTPDIVAIAAIIVCHRTKKGDAGVCTVMGSAVVAAVPSAGTARPMTTTYTVYQDVFELDPSTDAPWTQAGANAMAYNLERTA